MEILDEYGFEVSIPSICKPWDTSYVVISRETERFANEIHDHKEVKSSQVMSCSETFKNQKEMYVTKKER